MLQQSILIVTLNNIKKYCLHTILNYLSSTRSKLKIIPMFIFTGVYLFKDILPVFRLTQECRSI